MAGEYLYGRECGNDEKVYSAEAYNRLRTALAAATEELALVKGIRAAIATERDHMKEALAAAEGREAALRGALRAVRGNPGMGTGAIFQLRLMAKTADSYWQHRTPPDELCRTIKESLAEADRIDRLTTPATEPRTP